MTVREPPGSIVARAHWRTSASPNGGEEAVGHAGESDLTFLVRGVLDLCAPHVEGAPGASIEISCKGSFVFPPAGLTLDRAEVTRLARVRVTLHVEITHDLAAYEVFIRATEPPDRVEEYLAPRGAIPEIEVQFGLFGFQANLDEITKRLQLKPSWVASAAKPFTTGGHPLLNQWIYATGRARSHDFTPLVQRVMLPLRARAPKIAELVTGGNLEARLDFVVHYYADSLPPLMIGPELWGELAEMRAGLWFDAV